MKLTTIAAKLRMTAAEKEALAALAEDMDYAVEFVPAFIINWMADPNMFFNALESAGNRQVIASEIGRMNDRNCRIGHISFSTRA
jgi:hypothetical protein